MKSETQSSVAVLLMKRAGAVLLLLVFLALHALSSAHSLHAKLHHDVNAADHHCVIVQFSSGHCLGVALPVTLPKPPVMFLTSAPVAPLAFVSSACPILPGRAPPISPA